MRTRVVVSSLCSILLAGSVLAQELVIRGATVHVGDGATVLTDHDIVLRDGRIAAVGPGAGQGASASQVIDARGLHVSPGLTAAHTVLGLVEINAVRSTRDQREVGRINPHVRADTAVNPDSALLGVTMAGGVLHAMVVPEGALVRGRSSLMKLRGWTREDMNLKAPAALHVSWPDMTTSRDKGVKPGADEQENRRAEVLRELDDLLATAQAYLASSGGGGNLSSWERDARLDALAPVLSGELPVVVHGNDVPQMLAAMDWAERWGLRLVLAGARDSWRIADRLAAADVPVILGSVRALPRRDHEPYDVAYMAPVRLHEAGVRFCLTVGSGGFSAAHARNLPDEAAMAIAYGLPREAALAAVTSSPAQVFGLDGEIGRVEVGQRANLVVWDGVPLEVVTSAVNLIMDGREVPFDDRHSVLYRKYRSRPAPR
ncbi:MAG: amidohydrolase family protein [Acidobacteriota bacterium]